MPPQSGVQHEHSTNHPSRSRGRAVRQRPALAAGLPADPTFALIEQHQAAWDHFYAVLNEFSGKFCDEPPEYKARRDAASVAEDNALEALLTPEPTTLAGLRALAEYMVDYDVKINGFRYSDEPARWALAAIAETCQKLIPGGAA